MKVLLDVCTPVQVRRALPNHQVHTAVKMGWGELANGDLLRGAEKERFDLLIICDKNLRYQQNLATISFSIIVLVVPDNRLPSLEPLMPQVQSLLDTITPGSVVEVLPAS